ncbi:uncharacterized protein LOC113290673 [Papaver somniferum]|uniref:uncharacterized protein LOC113290673 n=1 Tax=Papaver somniferum TaxID=3469 RepID=UPI000E70438F|nr:uncharacterized protein LOC113290673 [Papaver somniferum]
MVLVSVKPKDVETDNAMLRSFPFSLVDMDNEWFYNLPVGSITTRTSMKKHFLEKYFPASKVEKIRKEIRGIVQRTGETLYEYWERYKRLCQSCPHNQITEQLIIQYFYEGLLLNDRTMIDAASGGALVDKTPAQARAFLENMASNSQQFSTRSETLFKKVNEVGDVSHMEQRMCNMDRMMQQISAVIVPSYEGNMEHANAIFQNQQTPSYTNKQAAAYPTFNQQGGYQFMQRRHQESQGTSVDEKFTLMMQGMQEISKSMQGFNQFQQKYEMDMRDVQNQVSQLDNDINLLKAQGSGKIPSQPLNHKENVNAIELRSGKQVKQPATSRKLMDLFEKSKKETLYKEIYEIFKNTQVNIPLIEAIRQVPRYAKFLEELCTKKHKLTGNEVMSVGENATAYLLKKLSPKLKDPGSFTVPCTIGKTRFTKSLLDLGASINVM